MLEGIVFRRLKHFVEECRHAKQSAIDPLTQKELDHFERLFQQRASEVVNRLMQPVGE